MQCYKLTTIPVSFCPVFAHPFPPATKKSGVKLQPKSWLGELRHEGFVCGAKLAATTTWSQCSRVVIIFFLWVAPDPNFPFWADPAPNCSILGGSGSKLSHFGRIRLQLQVFPFMRLWLLPLVQKSQNKCITGNTGTGNKNLMNADLFKTWKEKI